MLFENMPDFADLIWETRGKGRGVGGPRQGDGGTDICVCPNCGFKVKHIRGIPCVKKRCPKCGSRMRGL